jgi:hypothetical protein
MYPSLPTPNALSLLGTLSAKQPVVWGRAVHMPIPRRHYGTDWTLSNRNSANPGSLAHTYQGEIQEAQEHFSVRSPLYGQWRDYSEETLKIRLLPPFV